jgi:hypothetical protein
MFADAYSRRALSEQMHRLVEARVRRLDAPSSPARQPVQLFNSSPEVIRLAVLLYVKYPLSLRNVEDLLSERGIDISHETVR